jgi:1-acyl-sn-glycerol-3-phosphate acyltransferase
VIRTIWVLLAGGVLTFVLSATIWVLHAFGRLDVHDRCERIGRFWSRNVLRLSGVRVQLHAPDRARWPNRAVIVANHQSWFDVFALAATLPVAYRFVAKEELSRIPVFGTAWQACGHVSIPRKDRSRAIRSLKRASDQVREGKSAVILFPEGTRSPDGRLRAFKKGAFVLAINNEVPVIPVGISGSRHVMPKGSFRIRPGEIRIRVGDPISTDDLEHRHRNALLVRSRAAVVSLMEDPDALEQGGPPLPGPAPGSTAEPERHGPERADGSDVPGGSSGGSRSAETRASGNPTDHGEAKENTA